MHVRIETEIEGDVTADLTGRLNSQSILMAAGRELLQGVEDAFEREGPGWARLARSTVAQRRRLGFGPEHPIQHRTGSYKRSWKAVVSDDRLTVESQDFRAAILTRSGRRRPARPVHVPQDAVDAAVAAALKVVGLNGR